MSEHKTEALRLAQLADGAYGTIEHRNGADAVSIGVESLIIATEAQVHATLYLAEQQRIANLIRYVREIDDSGETFLKIGPLIKEGLGL